MRSKGIGKQLLNFVLNGEESINEQNPRAVGFYEYMGVETYKRTDLMKKEILIHYCNNEFK